MIPLIYLTGPMTGIAEYNYPLFHRAAHSLRQQGFATVNPAENGLPPNAPWASHMRRDLHALLDCQGVATLPGWEASKGAALEVSIARAMGMPVRSVDEWLGVAEVAT